jgi:hypothetical protein
LYRAIGVGDEMLSTYPLYSDIMVPAKFMLTNDFITVIVRLALLPVVMVRNTVDVEAEYD